MQDYLVLTVLVLGLGGMIACLHYIQVLRAHIRLYIPTYEELDFDPGPLDDAGLRKALCSKVMRSSKTHDRVQDAFEKLLRGTPLTFVENQPKRMYYMDE